MNVLGINYYFHDSSACIVRDGELLVAIEEERLSRDKHTTAFPRLAVRRCLDEVGMTAGDIDEVAVSVDPAHLLAEKAAYFARHPAQTRGLAARGMQRSVRRYRGLRRWLNDTWPRLRSRRPRITQVQHHMSHAAGSFLVSPFEEAALLCVDGSGEWATSLLGYGRGVEIKTFHQSHFPYSLGSFYEAVTAFCGFRPNYDEGKTMGLAPYGDPERFYPIVSDMVFVDDDGGIHLDLSWFSFHCGDDRRYSERFCDTFGQPRAHGEPFASHHKDVAAAFQRVLEERVLRMCEILYARTKSKHLVISGGVALNSVMNGRIVRDGPFEDLYVMPGAGDNGTCIGAAYLAACQRQQRRFPFVHDDPYLGPGYSAADIERAISDRGLTFERLDDVAVEAARLLAEGRIVGWFQGRMEFGPRALGNRSILANPTLADTKDIVNARVKHREPFRPFAPSVPVERAAELFGSRLPAPFMLKVCPVLPEHRWRLPAITHADGSARLQTVERRLNPRYHALLCELERTIGVPVVLNTSFNVMGQPIVESPDDAIECFLSTGIDDLIVGDYLIRGPAGGVSTPGS